MSKYTQDQLSAMAQSALYHKEHAPAVYLEFLLLVSLNTGLPPDAVERGIARLARQRR